MIKIEISGTCFTGVARFHTDAEASKFLRHLKQYKRLLVEQHIKKNIANLYEAGKAKRYIKSKENTYRIEGNRKYTLKIFIKKFIPEG